MKWTVGRLKEVLNEYPDDTEIGILFETDDDKPRARCQYTVPVLDIAKSPRGPLYLCHEWDYEGHYSGKYKTRKLPDLETKE